MRYAPWSLARRIEIRKMKCGSKLWCTNMGKARIPTGPTPTSAIYRDIMALIKYLGSRRNEECTHAE